ncbi:MULTISPECIES: hypothetical protein [unclassified Mesorhizobium]|nr:MULTISPECIES: hypothetical protein [unclassified Mesorhizobium]
MEAYDNQKGPKPEDVRHALKGWAFFIAGTLAFFGAAYAYIEM